MFHQIENCGMLTCTQMYYSALLLIYQGWYMFHQIENCGMLTCTQMYYSALLLIYQGEYIVVC